MKLLLDGEIKRRPWTKVIITPTHKSCSSCGELKEYTEFNVDSKSATKLSYYCKTCSTKKAREHHIRRVSSKDHVYIRSKRNQYYLNKYNVPLSFVEQLWVSQNKKCKICLADIQSEGSLTHLDHCHSSGKIRGLLCTQCNVGLGAFRDNQEVMMEAIKYLQSHTENGTQKEGRCP